MPAFPEALAIAVEHHQAGRLAEAERNYREIIAAEPNHPLAWHLLGLLAYHTGRHAAAVELIGRAVQLQPHDAEAHYHLGVACKRLGKLDQALVCYRRAVELRPDFPQAHNNLGVALKEAGRLDAAVAAYRRAIELMPDYAEAHSNLANALNIQGHPGEALACGRRALELKPDYAEAHNNLGNALKAQGRADEAAAAFRRALHFMPDLAAAHSNLGSLLDDQGQFSAALDCCRRAVQLKPDLAEAHSNLGNALKDLGRADEALACYRQALALKPDFAAAHSNFLLTLQGRPGVTLAELAAAHGEYQRLHAAPLREFWRPHANVVDPARVLRVGLVSPDFGRHPVGYFLIGALENLDRGQFHSVCYSDRTAFDDLTARFQAAAVWRDTTGSSDEQLADVIRADQVDILFDLAGHTARNRLLALARKPAPLQVTWAGYVGTTGLEALDYILADRYEIPAAAEPHYCERVLRMPDGYVCYDPPADAPPVSPPPALARGAVTFGSFNNPAKITAEVVQRWSQILQRVAGGRLRLRFRGLDDPGLARRCIELFTAAGVDPARLELLGPVQRAELLDDYRQVDIALDPFPYNGGLTTCEALWMGVPVVTCPGETFAGRHALSHLSNAGLTETIARDAAQYVDLAVGLAHDLPRLAALRARLRGQMAASPLCDAPRFAKHLGTVLREIWQRWCEAVGKDEV